MIINFIKCIKMSVKKSVRRIRIDNGTEFQNQFLDGFLQEERFTHNISAPYTPQKGFVERRNQSLCEAVRTVLIFANIPLCYWAKANSTICFTQNRSFIHHIFYINPYEIIKK